MISLAVDNVQVVSLFLVFFLTLGLSKEQSTDEQLCKIQKTCKSCVQVKINKTIANYGTCMYMSVKSGGKCSSVFDLSEEIDAVFFDFDDCELYLNPEPKKSYTPEKFSCSTLIGAIGVMTAVTVLGCSIFCLIRMWQKRPKLHSSNDERALLH